jgi:hypothetical protein
MDFDDIPIWLLFLITTILVVATIEVGYQLGNAARRRSEEEKESPVSAIAGTVLALLAFILAFTFGFVANKYDSRRELVRDQAAAIRTAFSRSDFLPEPSRDGSKILYNNYIDLIIEAADPDNADDLPVLISEAKTIETQLWGMAVENVRLGDNSDISAMYVDSINEMSNVLATRVAIAVQARMPTGMWYVLYALIALGMIAVGYQTAIAASRRSWVMVIMALSFSIVITVIAALDNPERGYLSVSQRPLTDLQAEMQQSQQP